MEYQNYVFDLYGTLVDICTDENQDILWKKMSLFYGYYGALYEPKELRCAYKRLVEAREDDQKQELTRSSDVHEAYPEIKLEYVFWQLFQEKGVEADLELAIHAGQFFRVLSTDYVMLYPGVKELLQAIRDKGKKIYLLSNAQRIFTEYEIRRLDIMKYFDGILISSECGCKKPDIHFFELLRERFQLEFSQSIMIGNDARSDIQGAAQVGMDTFYIHSNISPELTEKPKATYFIESMDLIKVREILGL